MTKTTLNFEVKPLSGKFGAEVFASHSWLTSERAATHIISTLEKHGVLVFPQLHLSDDDFVTMTRNMGSMTESTVINDGSSAASKGLYRISLDKEDKSQLDYVRGNDYWHTDGMVYEVPNKGTLLKCELPPSKGGETEFASLYAAFEALPEQRKNLLRNLRVEHNLSFLGREVYDNATQADYDRWNTVFPPRVHPLVWEQSNGRTSLLIGSTADHIIGMDAAESRALLDELLEWATQKRFTYLHSWQAGDLVMFHNPALLHRSRPYNAQSGRVMHRTTLDGTDRIH